MDNPDFLGLSSQEPHRVVSFPASQSLHASTASASTAISTGLPRLDEALCPSSPDDLSSLVGTEAKGIPGGHVTEVFGPPGVGKTSLALSIASNALRAGGKVVWIDTGSPLPRPRLRDFLTSRTPSFSPDDSDSDLSSNLLYIQTRTLPHLLSLLHHPPFSFPPPNTSLLVIDTISAPFQPYYPAPSDLKARLSTTTRTNDKSQLSWLLNRKWNVTSDLATQLSKFAATNRVAVLALNQMHTRIKGLPRATLTPVLAGGGWEAGVFARVGLYRDFVRQDQGLDFGGAGEVEGQEGRLRRVRFAEVMKRNGRVVAVRREEDTVVPFLIETDGLHAVDKPSPSNPVPVAETEEAEKPVPEVELEPTRASESEHGEELEELSQEPGTTEQPQLQAVQEAEPELQREVQQELQTEPEIQAEPEPEQQKAELQQERQSPEEEISDSLDTATRKRKVDEIADSQDEDDSDGEFGWNEDDDAGLLERD